MPRVVPTSLPVCILCNLGIAWHFSSYLDSAWKALILTVALYLEIRPTSRAQSLTMRACSVGAIMRCAWHGRSEKGRPGVRFLNEWVPRGAKSCHGCHAITLRCQGSLTTRPNHIWGLYHKPLPRDALFFTYSIHFCVSVTFLFLISVCS